MTDSIDTRIRAVIVQGSFVSGENVQEKWPKEMLLMLLANKPAIKEGKEGIMVSLALENKKELQSGQSRAVLQNVYIFGYHEELDRKEIAYDRVITLNSAFNTISFEPGRRVHRIAPTPLLIVVPETDAVIGTKTRWKCLIRQGNRRNYTL